MFDATPQSAGAALACKSDLLARFGPLSYPKSSWSRESLRFKNSLAIPKIAFGKPGDLRSLALAGSLNQKSCAGHQKDILGIARRAIKRLE